MMNKMPPWFKRHLRTVLLASIVLSFVPAYLRAYVISPGGVSEVPTILVGDTLIVNHAAYDLRLPYSNVKLLRTGSPQRGDMVVLLLPTNGRPAPKRVMGVPGDTIEVKESRVVINGQPLPVNTLNRSDFAWVPEADRIGSSVENEHGHWITYTSGKGEYRNHPPIRLADGQYFVIGDNRDMSLDSRHFGPVSENRIIGKVIAILPTGPRQRSH